MMSTMNFVADHQIMVLNKLVVLMQYAYVYIIPQIFVDDLVLAVSIISLL